MLVARIYKEADICSGEQTYPGGHDFLKLQMNILSSSGSDRFMPLRQKICDNAGL